MTGTATRSISASTTMTEARVRAVMQKVSPTFHGLAVAGHITNESARLWTQDISELQFAEALDYFEIQIKSPGQEPYGLRYRVRADGSVHQDSASGGRDLYGIPAGSSVGLYAHLHVGKLESVRKYLTGRGWGFDGKHLDAAETEQRAFSKDGYGIVRTTLGTWP